MQFRLIKVVIENEVKQSIDIKIASFLAMTNSFIFFFLTKRH
jgi:hypothetical protein